MGTVVNSDHQCNYFSSTGSQEGVITESAVAPLRFQFLGFPTVSGVCGVAFMW